ncbi:AmpG family muropeptide MFS transporter [Dongia sp.]|uniref:AmpG family muropeptide MFS transporter n=1 Tax=Dongia sp. TaxID=1977262 RepID=UPI003752336E
MSESTATQRKSWGEALAVYLEPRQSIILVMGFASGLPLLLTLSTLSYWLSKVGIDKTTIGLFALAGTPYTFKFLWSPVIDQMPLPVLTRLLGQRKGWLFLLQLFLAAAIFALGLTDPAIDPQMTAMVVLAVAFFSASQDIVVDAYRIEILKPEEQGAGAGSTQVGYRIGLLLAGAGAVALSDFVSWQVVFAVLAGAILICAVFTLFVPEPDRRAAAAPTVQRIIPGGTYAAWIEKSVIQPFMDFVRRPGWVIILIFILFYKFGDAFGGTMATPFYNELGFTGVEIAAISKVWGVLATALGTIVGGAVVARIGVFKTLMIGGVLQAVTNLLFSMLAMQGHDLIWLGIAISADNLAGGLAAAAFVAYLSDLCNRAFTATQYALLTSFMAYGRTLMSSGSGWLADHMPWVEFWAATALMAIPGLVFLVWITRLYPNEKKLVPDQAPAE